MASSVPNPDNREIGTVPPVEMTEDIVITGVSGRFPECDTVEEFRNNLYNNVDMVTDCGRRWKAGLFGIPRRTGTLKDLTKFDALFFGVHAKQADVMDPQLRILLEVTYEAIADAGYEAHSLRGENIGVFVGCSMGEAEEAFSGDPEFKNSYGLLGCSKTMYSNRVSFTFDFKGPSYTLDTGCSSSMYAFQQAMSAMKINQCSAAVVIGTNITLKPTTSHHFNNLTFLSPEGKCKAFDASCDGYCRSEAISAVFMQKASEARRKYATVVHAKCNSDGAKLEGITFPAGHMQKRLLREVFSEAKIDPREIAYIEAHGTGTRAGDPQELNAITDVYCEGLKRPLLVGSVKTNMGHGEAASGMSQIVKVVIAMEEDVIPANLHFHNPNPLMPALHDGRIKIVTENTPWKGGLVSINNFGFGGANAHVLLKSNPHSRKQVRNYEIPRLVICSGRTKETTENILRRVGNNSYPEEGFVLLEELAKAPTANMPYRAYAMLKNNNEVTSVVEKSPEGKRPLWFVFPGMGSQWAGMAKDMMRIDIFAKSILQSAEVLKRFNIDLLHLLTESSDEDLQEIVSPFITIVAVQIALVELARSLDIVPDGIVGHSFGEMGCAYASGCFTAEQMLLSAYWRGKVCEVTELPYGAMAAVGLTWEEAKRRCPKGVVPACHNSEDSVTISGPAEKVAEFLNELREENVFARGVKTCDIAFHSQYMSPVTDMLQKEMKKFIPNPKPRPTNWICSSIPKGRWNEPLAKFCSAEYFVNNLLSPVLFHDAMSHVPSNAITIEFAPHTLLQAILKRSLGSDSIYIGLMKRGNLENVDFFLSAVGKMHTVGLNPKVKNMYPPIPYPVPRGTPMMNHLIQWDHSVTWRIPSLNEYMGTKSPFELTLEVDVSSPHSADYFLTGHCIDGRVLFPATGYLYLAWKALARTQRTKYTDVPVVFENVSLHRATILPKTGVVNFHVSILGSSGEFEINEGKSVAVTGRVYIPEDPIPFIDNEVKSVATKESDFLLDSKDIYKELRLRGYEYGPTFQGLTQANSSGTSGNIAWNGNYISFMDTMMHLVILGKTTRGLYLPTRIESVKIDPRVQPSIVENTVGNVAVQYNSGIGVCFAGGVEIVGLQCSIAPRRQLQHVQPVLEGYQYVPNFQPCVLEDKERRTISDYIQVCSAIERKILETNGKNKAQIFEMMNGFKEASENVQRHYITSANENYVLLALLKNILDSPRNGLPEQVKSWFKKYEMELEKDVLSNVLLTEKSLRTTLDLVLENQTSLTCKILEVSPKKSLYKEVLNILQTYHILLQPNYTISHMSSEFTLEEGNDIIKNIVWDMSGSGPTEMDLIIAKDVLATSKSPTSVLQALKSALKENGFIMLMERSYISPAETFLSAVCERDIFRMYRGSVESACTRAGLSIVGKKSDDLTSSIYLLRNLPQNNSYMEKQKIIHVEVDSFAWVDELKEAMKDYQNKPDGENVWIVAEDNTSGVVGMVNCLRKEPGGNKIRCIFTNTSAPEFDSSSVFYEDMMKKDLVMNVYTHGQWGSYRHVGINADVEKQGVLQTQHAFLNVLTRGDLSSLKWVESPLKYWSASSKSQEQKLCNVYYAPLNFRDVMLASGKLAADALPGDLAIQDCIMGLEFSGRDESGKRVMGLVAARSMATQVVADPDFLFDVPEHWTMEQASTVPVAYATAYYALVLRGRLKAGESVLIHSGSGGVGQAAIAICLSMGCKVFTTVGSLEKRAYLKKRFPQLVDQNFSNSHSTAFEYDIALATKGKGVDVVLNSLAEEKLQASVRCLAQHGRFLEIGKYDLARNNPLGLSAFLRNISFHGIILDSILGLGCSQSAKRKVVDLLREGILSGVAKPLETTIFSRDQAEEAFRFMASGRHIGKVVIKVREEEHEKKVVSKPITVPAIPRILCHPCKSYIIAGGLGGFGLELANWLVDRGCKKLVLTSRTGLRSGYQKYCLKRWKVAGVEVLISTQNIMTTAGTTTLLNEASKLGPIGAIFNLAMVLRDALFEKLTQDDFRKVCDPKVVGTQNLDQISRQFCPDIEWFVVFSSISCGKGNAGQSNYGYANSVMERICEQRQKDGLPALAIQWGVVGDVGVVQETFGRSDVVIGGTLPQRIISCLATLDTFLQRQQQHTVVSSFVPAERSKGIRAASSDKDLVSSIGRILGVQDTSALSPNITLGELGMDSLMGTEVMQLLEREYDCAMTILEVRQLSIKKLQEMGHNLSGETNEKKKGSEKPQDKPVDFCYLIPKQVVVPLNKAVGSQPMFIVHPIEGVVHDLITVSSLLKKPCYGLQCTIETPQDSIQDMAHYYLQEILKIQPHGPYHICGYSFGAMVALEMAVMLQKNKKDNVNSLIFLDGSPEFLSIFTTRHHKRLQYISKEDRVLALAGFAMQFTIENTVEVAQELVKLQSWETQLDKVADIVMNCSNIRFKKSDVILAAESCTKKLACIHQYVNTAKFQGNATLIKATKSFVFSKNLDADYGLGKIVNGEVELHTVDGDHMSFLQGDSAAKVAKIINDKMNN